MKKLIALVMAAVMLCAAVAALAEEGKLAPLYATVGEAMADEADGRVISGGIPGEYYAVVTQKDGKYYRSVAYSDEKLVELNDALNALDYEAEDFFEKHEAATQAVEDHLKTLPIAYSEEFTAQPMTEEEMKAVVGKTLAQLEEEGFETGSNGTEPGEGEEPIIVYTMRYGVYDYNVVVDADFDRYNDAQENNTEGELVAKDVSLVGITEGAADLRFHADGTVDKPKDPFADLNEIMTEIGNLMEKAKAGEKIDLAAFAEELKVKFPDYADMIDMYVTLIQTYGVEGLMSMMTEATEAAE